MNDLVEFYSLQKHMYPRNGTSITIATAKTENTMDLEKETDVKDVFRTNINKEECTVRSFRDMNDAKMVYHMAWTKDVDDIFSKWKEVKINELEDEIEGIKYEAMYTINMLKNKLKEAEFKVNKLESKAEQLESEVYYLNDIRISLSGFIKEPNKNQNFWERLKYLLGGK